MKIVFKLIISLFLIIFFLLGYLTFIGFETKRFNNEITKKISNISKDLEIEIKEIKVILDPLKLKLKAKTIGSKLKNKNKTLEIESINTQISLRSIFEDKILIENLEISTKSLKIKDLISFIKIFNQNKELYILEKIVKKGFLIADIRLNFDNEGNVKKDFEIDGFVKDAKINFFEKYKIEKFNFNFKYKENFLDFDNINLSLNNLSFNSKKLSLKKIKEDFIISGDLENNNFDPSIQNINLFIKPYFKNFDINKIRLSSKNKFSFRINKKFEIDDFNLISNIDLKELFFVNNFSLNKILPKVKENIAFFNQKLEVKYEKKILKINGEGNILLQDKYDKLIYSIKKIEKKYDFKTSLVVNENPIIIDFINFKKNNDSKIIINVNGSKNSKNRINLDLISLEENQNKFFIKGLEIDEKFKIINLKKANIDYLDTENNKNKFIITNKNNNYYLKGPSFNANKLIDILINSDNNSNFINKKFKLFISLDTLFLDNNNLLNNFEGNLLLNNQNVIEGKLIGNFSKNKKLSYTVTTNNDEKITTLYMDKALPIVNRYKFIKGFDEGVLDFYSKKNANESISKLKIYDFKLKELPVLTKLLTLASLQGIADLLSGEGIRFNEFEMNFKNKESLMTIDEIYAIGPAISILMDGYIEKDKLVSLRGTLVPATTINKAIGSIPVLGKILVGSKTGEGVFGVSFKIKGAPTKIETTVNPIKTLTPRFITRTLEKIKKN